MQENEFLVYMRIIRRRWWLILFLFAVTMAVIFLTSFSAKPVYQGKVRIQVVASESGGVSLFSQARSAPTQEQIRAAQEGFRSALFSGTVAWQTIAQLNLSISAADLLDHLDFKVDGDFINVTYSADSPQEAEKIVTTHVENSLQYHRQLQARPATVLREFVSTEIETEEKRLVAARKNMLDFKLANNLDDLDREIAAYQDEIRNLQLERDRVKTTIQAEEATAKLYKAEEKKAIEASEEADARKATTTRDYYVSAARSYIQLALAAQTRADAAKVRQQDLEQMIARRESELSTLISLNDRLSDLQEEVNEAAANRNFLLGKLNEARLREDQALKAGFIQVIEPAREPDRPAPSQLPRIALVGAITSLLAGIILAFLLEFLAVLGREAGQSSGR